MNRHTDKTRVLAVDPANKRLGYVVMRGPARLVDWGLKEARDDAHSLQVMEDLIARFAPAALAVEDQKGRGSRRCPRVQKLIGEIRRLGATKEIAVTGFSRRAVKDVFARDGASNKHQIATAIAGRFPELSPKLPPERKPWMSEDRRMAIFDACSFALAFFERDNTTRTRGM